MATTPFPKFSSGEHADGVTVHASAALTGGRMVAQAATAPNGGCQVVAVPAAGAIVCGVMGEDTASAAKGLMWRPGQRCWIEASETLAAGDVVQTTNTGTAAVRTTGLAVGQVVEGNTVGLLALIEFNPSLVDAVV